MDENDIAAKFSEIVETEKLINHPKYIHLLLQLDIAAINLWKFMDEMGHSDIRSVKSQAYNITEGKLQDFFRYTLLAGEDKDSND